MPDLLSCKELASAWGMRSENHAGGQAWPPFREKLKALLRARPVQAIQLIGLLMDEIEQERFEASLPRRERMQRGRCDRAELQNV